MQAEQVLASVSFTGDAWVDGFLYAEASRDRRTAILFLNPWKPEALGERILLAAAAAGLATDVHAHRMKGRNGEWLRVQIKAPDDRFGPLVRKRDRRLPAGTGEDFVYGVLEGLARNAGVRPRFGLPPLATGALEHLDLPVRQGNGHVEAGSLDDRLREALRWRDDLADRKQRIQREEDDRIMSQWLSEVDASDPAHRAAALLHSLAVPREDAPCWHEGMDVDGVLLPAVDRRQHDLVRRVLPPRTDAVPLSWQACALAPAWRRLVEGIADGIFEEAGGHVPLAGGTAVAVRSRLELAAVLGIRIQRRGRLVVPAKDLLRLGRVLAWHGVLDEEEIRACLAAWVHVAVGPVCRGADVTGRSPPARALTA